MAKQISAGRKTFIVFNYIFCCVIAVTCILPVVHIFSVSFSSKNAVFSGHVTFWPLEFTLDSYRLITRDNQFFVSYYVSGIRALLGWLVNITMTVLAAYPLHLKRDRFPAQKFFIWFFVATMFFNGGMVPTYLVVRYTGLIDTIWALVIPTAVPVFNIILMKNFMREIPESLMESAFMDGASHFTVMLRIIVPLSKAAIATVSLFSILGHWNAWFDGMIYIKNMSIKPLQTYLRSIIIEDVRDGIVELDELINNVNADSSNGAKIFLALIPIIMIYPFLQKHFAKGIVLGSVKE